LVKLALVTQSFIGIFRRKNFFYKLFNSLLAFFLIFSLAFVTIETVAPEPVFATSQFTCFNTDGNPYGYQTKYKTSTDAIEVWQWDPGTGSLTDSSNPELEFTNLPGTVLENDEWNAAMMDTQGNLWMMRKTSSNNKYLYYMDATDSNNDGEADNSPDYIGVSGTGDNNAGTYFEHGGNKYLINSVGFFNSTSTMLIRIDGTNYGSSSNYTNLSSNVTISKSNIAGNQTKAKDFTWLRDGSSFPTLDVSGVAQEADFLGYDDRNQQVFLGYLVVSGSTFTIYVRDYSLSRPSGWDNTDVGASFGFGGDHAYMVHNNTGQVRKPEYNGSSWSWSSNLGTVQTNAKKK
jgi:hypothetical protein